MRWNYCVMPIFVIVLQSCDRPECHSSDDVFNRYTPFDREYKAKLVQLIRNAGPGRLSYWIDSRVEQDNKVYMLVNVQGRGICARQVIDITHVPVNDRLAAYRASKGGGYGGAELRGLKYRIDSSDAGYSFTYEKIDWLID